MIANQKLIKISISILSLFLLVVIYSCKKYENDENFMHFERVKKRLCQNWQLYSWQDVNGVEQYTANFTSIFNYSVNFKDFPSRQVKRQNKDWDGIYVANLGTFPSLKWTLTDKRNTLKSEAGYESQIVKLTDTEFWLADGKDPVNGENFKLLKYRKQ
ncbi:MAG: hypothetical protein MUC87_12090 [Bacteroidia bacterium]|jgi:hypothetical protein|nr:hypothetical protein [Bacteroidia bacterium]